MENSICNPISVAANFTSSSDAKTGVALQLAKCKVNYKVVILLAFLEGRIQNVPAKLIANRNAIIHPIAGSLLLVSSMNFPDRLPILLLIAYKLVPNPPTNVDNSFN